MYEGVQEVLSDWPDLVRRFVGFLGPDEALSAGLVRLTKLLRDFVVLLSLTLSRLQIL